MTDSLKEGQKGIKELSIVGKSVPRIEGGEKVAEETKFVADILLPNILYGKILRSKYPHAKILKI